MFIRFYFKRVHNCRSSIDGDGVMDKYDSSWFVEEEPNWGIHEMVFVMQEVTFVWLILVGIKCSLNHWSW